MNRREALAATARVLGGSIVGAQIFLTACKTPEKKQEPFSPDDIAFLDAVGEVIIPTTTDSPGAKAAHIGDFMRVIVTDCYSDAEHKIFVDGMTTLKELSRKKYDKDFVKLSGEEQNTLLSTVNKEAKAYATTKREADPEHYFTLIKQLTTWGYFTSEPGATKALNYLPVPGRFEGCVPYTQGEKAWAL
jgi:hypothetical protein